MGIDKDGKPKANYQPGMDIIAQCTILGEGVRGSCTKQLIDRFDMHGKNPQSYETGIKEIWRVQPEKHKPGRVVHGSMFPDFFGQINGMWLYDMGDNLISYGFVTPLSAEDPNNDPHRAAQEFKRDSPFMRDLLEGAELVRYGAKCVPAGGLYGQPKLYTNGAMLVGDSAGMLNIMKLAGIHQAIKTGMLAAEAVIDGLKAKDFSSKTIGSYAERYKESWAYEEHYEARNFTGSNEISPVFGMAPQHPAHDCHQGPRALRLHPDRTSSCGHEEDLGNSERAAKSRALRTRWCPHLLEGASRRLLRHPTRGRSAAPSQSRRHQRVFDELPHGLWQSVREVLPRCGL